VTRLIAFLCLLCSPAYGANCAARPVVVERLENIFHERLEVGGLQKANGKQSIMEIWASDETGTYTVILTDVNGLSCIVAAGTAFFKAKAEPPGVPG